MEKNVSFIELLKEITDLIRDHRPFNRGTCTKQIAQVIRAELIRSAPKSLSELNLCQAEEMFVVTLLVEPGVCSDIIKHFARFWTDSFETALKMQMELDLSIHQGRLRELIDDRSGRLHIKDDIAPRVLLALVESFDRSTPNREINDRT